LADWLTETKRLGKWDVTGGVLTGDAAGMHLSINPSDGMWAKIIGGGTGGKYSWQEVVMSPYGDEWVFPDNPQMGATDWDPAIEAGFSETVAADTVVYLFPGMVSGIPTNDQVPSTVYRIFFAGGGGGAGGCGGPVSSVQCVGNVLYVTYGS
jgi:hypothetical protein